MSFRRATGTADHGGNAYGKKPYRSGPGKTLSFRCRDCSTIRYVSQRELNRAARPRCLGCGGPLMETDATAEETMSAATAENAKALNESSPAKNGHCRCWGCDLAYRKNFYLGKHLEESESCREQYKVKDKIVVVSDGRFYAGTFSMLKEDRKIKIMALSADSGEWCDVAEFDTIYKAEAFVRPHTISLHAVRIKQHWQEQPKPVQRHVRCPVCHSKFIDSVGLPAEYHLETHLTINDYCFAQCDKSDLKESAAQRRDSKW